jgi:hypothetical protein
MTELLKAEELRIGNYLHHTGNWSYRQPNKYFKEFDFQWNESDWYSLGECKIDLKDIEPIPLTEEWLLKFGFINPDLKMSGHIWLVYKRPHLHKMDIRIAVPKYDNDWSVTLECVSPPTTIISHIKYVHQLQNLYYALTGNELKISDGK